MNGAPFEKRPDETVEVAFDFSEYLASVGESISTWEVLAEPGPAFVGSFLVGGVVTAAFSGGTHAHDYRAGIRIRTERGLIEVIERVLKVRGRPLPVVGGGPGFGGQVVPDFALLLEDGALMLGDAHLVLAPIEQPSNVPDFAILSDDAAVLLEDDYLVLT